MGVTSTHYTLHTALRTRDTPGTIQQINGEEGETYHQITICITQYCLNVYYA